MKHGVHIVGDTNLRGAGRRRRVRALRAQRARLPQARSSQGRHAQHRLDDDIVAACLMTQDGEVTQAGIDVRGHRHGSGHHHHTIINLIIFVLAIYVGYHVVWTVTPALHTPLMAVTNAISAIVIVGAMLAAGAHGQRLGQVLGRAGRGAGSLNVFGGFLVTQTHARNVQEEGA